MSQNYDEVTVDLAAPEKTNTLAQTSQMEFADMTDCVSKIELLSSTPGIELEFRPAAKPEGYVPVAKRFNPRELIYQIKKHGRHVGRLVFNVELGSIELSEDGQRETLVGTQAVFRITRDNHNRRPRVTARA